MSTILNKSMKKIKCNVVLLPTLTANIGILVRAVRDIQQYDGKIQFENGDLALLQNRHLMATINECGYSEAGWLPQNVYFVSERESKSGDIVYALDKIGKYQYDEKYKTHDVVVADKVYPFTTNEFFKKVEASTDLTLQLPIIPLSFLSAYVEQQIEQVLIRINKYTGKVCLTNPNAGIYNCIWSLPQGSYSRSEVEDLLAAYQICLSKKLKNKAIDELVSEFPQEFEFEKLKVSEWLDKQ